MLMHGVEKKKLMAVKDQDKQMDWRQESTKIVNAFLTTIDHWKLSKMSQGFYKIMLKKMPYYYQGVFQVTNVMI